MKDQVSYSDEVAAKICEAIASGSSVREACEAEGMPHEKTVYKWMANNSKFREMYEAAQETRAELFVNEIVDLSENIDTRTNMSVAAAKIHIDTKKWAAGKFNSRRFGDKQQIDVNANVKIDRASILEQARRRLEGSVGE